MPNYTHRPLQVFATQYTGENAEEIRVAFPELNIVTRHNGAYLYILNIREPLCVSDYIVRDHKGNISVMGEKEFEERYAPIS